MIHFISDTHFGHNNIIKYCRRPFQNSVQMDDVIIRQWKERVDPDDEVYHLEEGIFKAL